MDELFEIGADVDVEALMASIREKVRKRKELSTKQSYGPAPSLKSADVLALIEEIRNGELLVDAINQVPRKRRALGGALEFSIKRFLKWLVHWNTKQQASFNRSTLHSVELIARHLQDIQDDLEETRLARRELRKLTGTIEEVRLSNGDRLSELWWQVGRDVKQLRRDLARQVDEHASSFSAKIDEAAQRVRQQSAGDFEPRISAFEREVERLREENAQIIELANQRISELVQKADANETRTSGLEQRMTDELTRLRLETNQLAAANETHTSNLEQRMTDELLRLRLEANQLAEQASGQMSRELDELRMRLLRAERNLRKDINSVQPPRSPNSSEQTPNLAQQMQRPNGHKERPEGPRTVPELPFDYFMFEHRFRGSVSDIKQRQTVYLDLFSPQQTVVDLGCGRGEFVELLMEHGVNVTGVDSNEDMVDFCGDRGLRVLLADAFDYLSSLPDLSLDGITAIQLIEHMELDQIWALMNLCVKKLKPGGLMLAETVNTDCPLALANFYLDPSHVRPVPAELLRFILEQAALKVDHLTYSSPAPGNDVSEVLKLTWGASCVYQDYAILARKGEGH